MEFEQSLYQLSSEKHHRIPPDVNEGIDLFLHKRWYSNLAIPLPIVFLPHITTALVFGILTITFGALHKDIIQNPTPFWNVFPEFLAALITVVIVALIHFRLFPVFWRCRARQAVNEGWFDSSMRKSNQRQLVLDIGCNEGPVSAIFAQEIIRRQRDVGDLTARHASMPVFIGYDRWTAWSRLPNSPACYLSTLMDAGVPRDCIIANRTDRSSTEAKTHLPYPSESISLVICFLGITELHLKRPERTALFHEMVRVLEPGGRILLVESSGVGVWTMRNLWEGAVHTYRRILIEDLGWPPENAVNNRRELGVRYLIAVKPPATNLTV